MKETYVKLDDKFPAIRLTQEQLDDCVLSKQRLKDEIAGLLMPIFSKIEREFSCSEKESNRILQEPYELADSIIKYSETETLKQTGIWLENETRGVNFGAWAYWWQSVISQLKSGVKPYEKH